MAKVLLPDQFFASIRSMHTLLFAGMHKAEAAAEMGAEAAQAVVGCGRSRAFAAVRRPQLAAVLCCTAQLRPGDVHAMLRQPRRCPDGWCSSKVASASRAARPPNHTGTPVQGSQFSNSVSMRIWTMRHPRSIMGGTSASRVVHEKGPGQTCLIKPFSQSKNICHVKFIPITMSRLDSDRGQHGHQPPDLDGLVWRVRHGCSGDGVSGLECKAI